MTIEREGTGVFEKFSFPSYRRLFQYLGETDAMVELTELAARSFLASAKDSKNIVDFVKAKSKLHNININLSEVSSLPLHLSKNYIVIVYYSAERFFHQFRKEHRLLYELDWTGDSDDVDPLTLTLNNIAGNRKTAEETVGRDLISRFQYYRLVRNWVVHSKGANPKRPEDKYENLVPYSVEHKTLFAKLSAPHRPEELDFDDFILFSRLTKLVAKKICEVSIPPVDKLIKWLQTTPRRHAERGRQNPTRRRNALIGMLRTEFGMDVAEAGCMVDRALGPLA